MQSIEIAKPTAGLLANDQARIRNMHGDLPRTSVVDDRDPVISTRSIVEHELAMAPNHIPTLLSAIAWTVILGVFLIWSAIAFSISGLPFNVPRTPLLKNASCV